MAFSNSSSPFNISCKSFSGDALFTWQSYLSAFGIYPDPPFLVCKISAKKLVDSR